MKIKGWAVVCENAIVHGRKVRNYVLSIHTTRSEARKEKFFQGGKEDGVKIVKLIGDQEIR